MPIEKLVGYARNPRKNDAVVDKMVESIREFGFRIPIVARSDGSVVDGHLRLKAAKALGMTEVPVAIADDLTDTQIKAFRLLANQSANWAEWDEDLLKLEIDDLRLEGFDVDMIGFDDEELVALEGDEDDENSSTDIPGKGSLAERFGVPPFSVLSARDGWWQDRKKAWLALGIESDIGRDANVLGAGLGTLAARTKSGGFAEKAGISIFDPVLCELSYRWFAPKGGVILDPFAGGSVRGIVAARLGHEYVGIDLRKEQVEANREQADRICDEVIPVWHCGDSREIDKLAQGVKADFVFSCPPYADLEVYSDDPRDLSNLEYDEFISAYREIIRKAVSMLKDDSFAAFVVGEVRKKDGNYYGFVPDTIKAFEDAGAKFYNEMILVTMLGTVPQRAAKSFEASRKVGKTHQNVLLFCKGDAKKATMKIGPVDFGDMEAGE